MLRRTSYFFIFLIISDLILTQLFFSYTTNSVINIKIDSQAIAVFFHGKSNDYKLLSKETIRRLNHVKEIYNPTQTIICIGGSRPNKNFYGSVLMKNYLTNKNIPEQNIIVELKSRDSKSNLKELINKAKIQSWNNIAIVSSPLHVKRLTKITKTNSAIKIIPAPYIPDTCSPKLTFLDKWIQTHYEWIAIILNKILSEDKYKKLINTLRN